MAEEKRKSERRSAERRQADRRKTAFLAAMAAVIFSAGAWALERAPSRPQPQSQTGQPVNPSPQAQPAATPAAAAPSPEQCPPAGQRVSVAIYPIKPAGAGAELASAMTALLTSKITPSPKLKVIEEAMLKTVLERQAMNVSDACDDTSCQVEIGKLVQAQKLITGDLTKFGSKYILSLKLVDIQTGATEFSTEDQCACPEDQLDSLVAVAAAKVRNHFCDAVPMPELAQTAAAPATSPPPAQVRQMAPVSASPRFDDLGGKLRQPSPGKSMVYFVRPSSIGLAVQFKVKIDDQEIGSTFGGSYLEAEIDPGAHEIVSRAENRATLQLQASPDQIYFIEQKPSMGVALARNKLTLLDFEEGKKALNKCRKRKQ